MVRVLRPDSPLSFGSDAIEGPRNTSSIVLGQSLFFREANSCRRDAGTNHLNPLLFRLD